MTAQPQMIKAIETQYKGYRFRSRLEARWAIFFDHMGFEWEYESEGFELSSGWYLPDFRLHTPSGALWVEVKPDVDTQAFEETYERPKELACKTNTPLLALQGAPAFDRAHLIFVRPSDKLGEDAFWVAFFRDYTPSGGIAWGDMPVFRGEEFHRSSVGLVDQYWAQYVISDEPGRFYFEFDEQRARKAFGLKTIDAVKAARSARFEHGESPIL